MIRVLFICMGNICRSPTAEAVLQKYVTDAGLDAQVEIDSAGTLDYHTGSPADPRSIAAARQRGFDLARHRARQVTAQDIERYDYLLAMDYDNLNYLKKICPPGLEAKLRLFLEFAPDCGRDDVPDPYAGGADGFESVLDLVDIAARGLLAELLERTNRPRPSSPPSQNQRTDSDARRAR